MLNTRLLLSFLTFFLQQATAYPVLTPNIDLDNTLATKQYFEQIRYISESKTELTNFFKAFPKGGELHHHFMGASPPSVLLDEAIDRSLCLKKDYTFAVCTPGAISAENATRTYQQQLAFREALTTTDLTAPVLTRHEAFFGIFGKILEVYDRLPVSLMNDIRQRAAQESLYYIESMTYWSERDGPTQLFELLDDLPPLLPLTTSSMAQFMDKLTSKEAFQEQVNTAAYTFRNVLEASDKALSCNTASPAEGCKVTVRFLHETHRTNTPEQVFAQLVFSIFLSEQSLASANSLVLGINIVGAEDARTSRTDYLTHMKMLAFLKNSGQFPLSSMALHAGEMNNKLGSFKETSFSLSEAITMVLPKRIGHGVSLAEQHCATLDPQFQTCSAQLADLMNRNNMAIEVQYISNEVLLNTTSLTHPLPLYMKYGVPVVLATDDPGILKTDMTAQFVEIAYNYSSVSFDDLVTMTRNSLEYSFLPGKSLWQKSKTGKPIYLTKVSQCQTTDSDTCKSYLQHNPKAAAQLQHENHLAEFMTRFGSSTDRPHSAFYRRGLSEKGLLLAANLFNHCNGFL